MIGSIQRCLETCDRETLPKDLLPMIRGWRDQVVQTFSSLSSHGDPQAPQQSLDGGVFATALKCVGLLEANAWVYPLLQRQESDRLGFQSCVLDIFHAIPQKACLSAFILSYEKNGCSLLIGILKINHAVNPQQSFSDCLRAVIPQLFSDKKIVYWLFIRFVLTELVGLYSDWNSSEFMDLMNAIPEEENQRQFFDLFIEIILRSGASCEWIEPLIHQHWGKLNIYSKMELIVKSSECKTYVSDVKRELDNSESVLLHLLAFESGRRECIRLEVRRELIRWVLAGDFCEELSSLSIILGFPEFTIEEKVAFFSRGLADHVNDHVKWGFCLHELSLLVKTEKLSVAAFEEMCLETLQSVCSKGPFKQVVELYSLVKKKFYVCKIDELSFYQQFIRVCCEEIKKNPEIANEFVELCKFQILGDHFVTAVIVLLSEEGRWEEFRQIVRIPKYQHSVLKLPEKFLSQAVEFFLQNGSPNV